MAFKQVNSQVDFPELEKEILKWWYDSGVVQKYLHKNDKAKKKFSFLDGPITANNPMGVHHSWGRTYKDIWQRYYTMRGYAGRYQNGFDCQGLWVEVEVEKELGFKSKKDIETYGVANFVNKCKERVLKYSTIQTEQSKHLGYFMDWDHSYFTMSDENNYAIWGFLKECWSRGWIYKGHDVVPWCPRCETAISQHEILTEDYQELTHDSIFLQLPVVGHKDEFLLIWTTTPWTLPVNTAVAVDKKLDYSLVVGKTGLKFWVASALVGAVFGSSREIIKTVSGQKLVGLHYISPFDDLPLISQAIKDSPGHFHVVIATDDLLMPISTTEGTGLVHTSTSTGEEDHKLGLKLHLPVIPAIDDEANYLPGFGQFTGQNAKKHPEIILDYLKQSENGGFLFAVKPFTHRYPACWRCRTELVWKVADEWYISMDKLDPTDPQKLTYRQQMLKYARNIHWLPDFGRDRELDWLKNMHDWLISKKNRYWGLALPIYECTGCHAFEIIGSRDELKNRAVSGWVKFNGNTPHKPWIDEVKIKCTSCGKIISRIADVGNPWLDAGIVGISTLPATWFPADFITESFPGQFKNWFYSLIAMSTVLKKSSPTKNILGYASLLAEDGRPMHKSWGNAIEFNEGADKIGVDVMRWMYILQNPENNLLFGYKKADETRRQFHILLWNIYKFFVTYANIDGFTGIPPVAGQITNILDIWIISRLNQTINEVTSSLNKFDPGTAGNSIARFTDDLSLWYVRRSRDRVGPTAINSFDKTFCYHTLYTCLIKLSLLLAPFNPFISEEIFKNLTGEESVHLAPWPEKPKITAADQKIITDMMLIRKIVELGLGQRKNFGLKVRQPLNLATITYIDKVPDTSYQTLIQEELNIKKIKWVKGTDLSVDLETVLTPELVAEGKNRELIRQIQESRKAAGARLDQKIILTAPLPEDPVLLNELKIRTLADKLIASDQVSIKLC